MKTFIKTLILIPLFSLLLTSCLKQSNTGDAAQNAAIMNDIISICGAMVGTQAEQRINQEWEKYPGVAVNRPIIEAVAESLLNDPSASDQQRTSQYKKYITCATGILVTNGFIQ